LNFGEALEALKRGDRVTRAGWNGQDMWLALMPAFTIPANLVNERTRRFVPRGDLSCGGYIVIWTHDSVWQPGWLATQADMLAEDWELVF
jgi:hypothetical protein